MQRGNHDGKRYSDLSDGSMLVGRNQACDVVVGENAAAGAGFGARSLLSGIYQSWACSKITA